MNELSKLIDRHTVRFERRLPGPIERVWAYLTQPEYLSTWLAQSDMQLWVGGQVELRFDVEEVPARRKAGAVNRGVVTRYDPPHALAYTWVDAADPSVDSHVTFELEQEGKHVLLVLTHRRLPTQGLAKFGAGWHTHLGVLLARLQAETPEPFLEVYNRMMPHYTQAAQPFSDS